MASVEESNVVKAWGKFKIDLCDLLTREDLRQSKAYIKGKISESRREEISEQIDLLEALEDNGSINEDQTDYLIEMLQAIEHVEALEELNVYRKLRRKYRENVKLLCGKHDPLFVGRDDYIREIIDVFGRSANLVSCVCLHGLSGTGKTTLALETSLIYKQLKLRSKFPEPRILKVDLRKRSNITDAGIALLTSVGRQVAAKDFDPSMLNRWIRECNQENVIILDNSDELLQPQSLSRDHFINMMMDLLTIHSTNVKLIITSQYAMRFTALNDKSNFKEIKVRPLEVTESIRLLEMEYHRSHREGKTISEDTVKEIATHCGNNPQALRAVANQLKYGMSAEDLAKTLRNPHLVDHVLTDPGVLGSLSIDAEEEETTRHVLQTLKATFDLLPVRRKDVLVRLSVFPGSFDQQKAKVVLGVNDIEVVDLDINDLRIWSLVECEEYPGFEHFVDPANKQYAIHQLIRNVCMIEGMKGAQYHNAFIDALDRMCQYVASLMEQLSLEGHTDYRRGLARFEKEKLIVTHYMEMDMGETFAGFPIPSPLLEEEGSGRERARLSTSANAESIYNLFECFMHVEQLERYFRCKIKQMNDKNEMEAWALLSGWLADQYMVGAKYTDAWETLKAPLDWLQSLSPPLSKDAELARAQCKAIQGRYLSTKPAPDYKQAIQVVEEALNIRKKYLRDNTLTARCLNLLGSVYLKLEDTNKSKSYHEQAWAMLVLITNGHPEQHFDSPTVALNIGTAYHQLGNKESNKHQKAKAKEFYKHAISFFNRALEIEKRLQLEGNPNTATILKNKAMSYCEMKEYGTALSFAVKASEHRKKRIGTHPDTARSLYFVGSLYHSMGKEEKKASNMPEEEIQSFKDALKYYKEALKYEWKLGPERRSWEYNDLKKDFKQLLQLIHEDSQPYEELFHQAEQPGGFDAVMPERTGEASTSSPKRKLTGLEDMPDSPTSSECLLL